VRPNQIDPDREREILAAALSGEEAGFSAFYKLYSPRVYAYTMKRVSDPAVAEDLAQEVFLQIHTSLKTFGGRSSLVTWIFGIAHNVVSHYYRTHARSVASVRAAEMPDQMPLEPERRIDAVRALSRCAEVLSRTQRPAQQKIFYMRYRESDSICQIAEQVGKSNEAVKASLRRSRFALLARIPELHQFLDGSRDVAA
jgi:RNA polymerase sigma-70 factor (ECF subfamily)